MNANSTPPVAPPAGNPAAIVARIRAVSASQIHGDFYWTMEAPKVLEAHFSAIVAGGLRQGNRVFAVVGLGMQAAPGKGEPTAADGGDLVFSVNGLFVAQYILDDGAEFNDDDLQLFARVNGPFSVYPYWREFLASSIARMGVPHFVPPQFNPGRFLAEPLDPKFLVEMKERVARWTIPEPVIGTMEPSPSPSAGT